MRGIQFTERRDGLFGVHTDFGSFTFENGENAEKFVLEYLQLQFEWRRALGELSVRHEARTDAHVLIPASGDDFPPPPDDDIPF
jgi:hypothetical protein